jgi:hypothetical protein
MPVAVEAGFADRVAAAEWILATAVGGFAKPMREAARITALALSLAFALICLGALLVGSLFPRGRE